MKLKNTNKKTYYVFDEILVILFLVKLNWLFFDHHDRIHLRDTVLQLDFLVLRDFLLLEHRLSIVERMLMQVE